MNAKDQDEILQRYSNFFDPAQVRENLLIAALYLAAFEVLKSILIGRVRSFFAFNFTPEGEWDAEKIRSKEYLKAIKKYYPSHKVTGKLIADEYIACARWFENSDAITLNDVETLIAIRGERNKVAHELPDILIDPEKKVDVKLIVDMARLINKLDKWWVIEVEMSISPPDMPPDAEIDYDGIVSGRMVYMNHIFRMVLDGHLDEEEELKNEQVK